MFNVSPAVKIFVCTKPIDMRRSFDGLFALVESLIGQDPFSGALFLFRSKSGNFIKVLWWDGDGCATRGRSNMNGIKLPREPPFPVLT